MSIWADIIETGYEIGKEAGLWKKLRTALRKKKKILLLGASGAGKSQFVESISDVLSVKLTTYQRTTSVERRKAVIDEYPFIILDTPGQILDEAKRKKAINEVIRTGVEGILNMVCYGYHETDEADKSKALSEMECMIANPEFLYDRRRVELDLLSEWVPKIDAQTANWILTVVTKADLWWPDINSEIRDYYESGEYSRIILETNIDHSVIPYCSVIEPFYGTRTSGKFGDHQRKNLRNHLLESLIRLTGVER